MDSKKNFVLETERLKLEPFEEGDIYLFHRLNIDPYVRKFLWDNEMVSVNLAQEIMEKNANHFEDDNFGLWKISLIKTDEIIGYTGLWYFFDEPQPQLIFALSLEFTGQGFAAESAELVMRYSFEELHFQYLLAATDESHKASQKVVTQLGLELVETVEKNGKRTRFFRKENPKKG